MRRATVISTKTECLGTLWPAYIYLEPKSYVNVREFNFYILNHLEDLEISVSISDPGNEGKIVFYPLDASNPRRHI